ncbi:patatin-like phospholipase family protein [Mycolicibacillus parakoreensis]|uniref:Patatin-like phospholipase family protein n=1 Tax=Mycolicibacillus parakoreensis TaxID=1069221 RepID=A0ABY3U173_9MYCO|nr:patatin-like phospholipase family protein [Mycolicibacillus parakoreensis]MCV7314705.1 patatin-like phospholipase family protein [Mycolicibacillus parakoreensis]ULN53718.1 patatin-like phospholipase family protein [Mycolicibacillus parakoreensis]
MQIPFVDNVLARTGLRRPPEGVDDADTGQDFALPLDQEVVEDEVDTSDDTLLLQKMENRLVRNHLNNPEVLGAEELRRLRYLLNFARLADFEPGAAGPGGTRGRGDVSVGAELTPWRTRVADTLRGPLREQQDPVAALTDARAALTALRDDQDEQRAILAERHGNDFSLAELDTEVGYKKLVTVLGGGGGAGFVYIGGMQRLLEAGQVPDYLIGSSFGSVLGSVVARTLPVPIDEYVQWAKSVSFRAILGPESRHRTHGLTGVFSLRFDRFADAMFRREDGALMTLSDLDVPFDAVVAGVRRQPFAALPSRYRRQRLAALQLRSLPYLPIGLGPQVAARLWQTAAFIDPRVVTPIVIGGDNPDTDVNVVDAASFSSAIPGVLHHETADPAMVPLFDRLLADNDVGALVDGGAASNVPVELAWKRVRDGRLGTRNACYLAFDCFHPQWDPRNLWLVPITQAISLQMVRNAPYADHLVRFTPTLSPVNLAPSAHAIDRACRWGHDSTERAVTVMGALLDPVWWDGDAPPAPATAATRLRPAPASMNAVLAALGGRRNRFERWRGRRQS